MLQRRRKVSGATEGAFALEEDTRLLTDEFLRRTRRKLLQADIRSREYSEPRAAGGRFRWIVSTCLAATIGAIAILVVVYGSSDNDLGNDGLLPTLKSLGEGALVPQIELTPKNAEGLKWITPKADRLQLTTGALSTRYIIHESSKSRRDSREYVRQKPYARIVARLGAGTRRREN